MLRVKMFVFALAAAVLMPSMSYAAGNKFTLQGVYCNPVPHPVIQGMCGTTVQGKTVAQVKVYINDTLNATFYPPSTVSNVCIAAIGQPDCMYDLAPPAGNEGYRGVFAYTFNQPYPYNGTHTAYSVVYWAGGGTTQSATITFKIDCVQ